MKDNIDGKYQIHMKPQFDFLQLMDVSKLIAGCDEKWYNQTLCKINNHLIRLGVFNEGDFHWHKHDSEDEFFFVLSGELFIETKNADSVGNEYIETVAIKAQQGFSVPKGVLHRPYVKTPTAVLMVEGDSVIPTGDK